MTLPALQEFLGRHMISTGALTAVAAALDARASGVELDPALAARVNELLATLGADRVLDDIGPQEATIFRSIIRAMYLLDSKLLFEKSRAKMWNHTEPEILQSIGEAARLHAHDMTRVLIPACDGLPQRFGAKGASMLDVGVGVAGSAIAMLQMWPELRIVGVDPWQPSLRLARENVERAGLGHRIELREQGIEALTDEAAYDFVWFANHFIPEANVKAGLVRALRALRPGGWLVAAANNDSAPAPMAALWNLRTLQWSGTVSSSAYVEKLLRDAGFSEVRVLPTAPTALATFVLARRS